MAEIPVGLEYASTAEGQTCARFRCRACGHETLALVSSKGAGKALALAFIGQDAAKQRAVEGAKDDLQANAETLAASAPCPSCGASDRASAELARGSAMRTAVVTVGAGLALFFFMPGSSEIGPLLPLIALGAAFWNYGKASWKWAEAGTRVRFLTRSQLEAVERGQPLSALSQLAFVWGAALEDAGVRWPWAGSLHVALIHVHAHPPVWLEHRELEQAPLTQAYAWGLAGLAEASAAPLSNVAPGLWQGRWGDGLAASRLVLPQLFADLKVRGIPVAFTASEDTLFIAGADDAAGLALAFERSGAHLSEVLKDQDSTAGRFTAFPWRLVDGRWQPWRPPPEHPLHAGVEALALRLGDKGWRPDA